MEGQKRLFSRLSLRGVESARPIVSMAEGRPQSVRVQREVVGQTTKCDLRCLTALCINEGHKVYEVVFV
jgi:hypothetical protein